MDTLMELEMHLEECVKLAESLDQEIHIREFSLVRTKLEEALMWLDRGVKERL